MGYMCTPLNNEIIVCMLSVLFFFWCRGLEVFCFLESTEASGCSKEVWGTFQNKNKGINEDE